MKPSQAPAKACHNCRRNRLKCDRSLPHCLKCSRRGEECLGYQRLLRWERGVASRGKMAGVRFEEIAQKRAKQQTKSSHAQSTTSTSLSSRQMIQTGNTVLQLKCLTDPLVQDLSQASRGYLFYCKLASTYCCVRYTYKRLVASDVCRDLVLYDIPKQNSFRELIPMAQKYPALLQIIIANSALHTSNTWQKNLNSDSRTHHLRHSAGVVDSSFPKSSTASPAIYYNHALSAKQQALHLLRLDLTHGEPEDVDVTLAVVLLFIEFALLDSGRDDWRYHVKGARTIIETFCGPSISKQMTMSPLRSCLISNCMVYDKPVDSLNLFEVHFSNLN